MGKDRSRRYVREGGWREGSARLTGCPATGWPAYCSHGPLTFLSGGLMVNTVVRPATSWLSVLGGWIATIGAMALVAPAVAGVLAGASVGNNEIAPAVPVIVGIFVSYLIGGFGAGRRAGDPPPSPRMPPPFFSPVARRPPRPLRPPG